MVFPKLHFFRQLGLTLVASLASMHAGLCRGWPSTGLPSIIQLRPDLLPEGSGSWVASISILTAVAGSLAAAFSLLKFGRKRSLQIAAPLMAIGSIWAGFSNDFATLMATRSLLGLAAGMGIVIARMYVVECAKTEHRGMLGSIPQLFTTLGILLSHILGSTLDWNVALVSSAVVPLLSIILILPFPESPSWLFINNRTNQMVKAMKWLHRDYQQEMVRNKFVPEVANRLQNVQEKEQQEEIVPLMRKSHRGYLASSAMKPFAISALLMFLAEWTGTSAVTVYTVAIFESTDTTFNNHVLTIIIGIVQVLAAAIGMLTIDKLGRKPLLYISCLFSTLGTVVQAAYFTSESFRAAKGTEYVPIISLSVHSLANFAGLGSVALVLSNELIPEKQRSVLSSVAGLISIIGLFSVVKTYPALRDSLGDAGPFWIYSATSVFIAVFVRIYVPETKGKTLKEIENIFRKKSCVRKKGSPSKIAAVVSLLAENTYYPEEVSRDHPVNL